MLKYWNCQIDIQFFKNKSVFDSQWSFFVKDGRPFISKWDYKTLEDAEGNCFQSERSSLSHKKRTITAGPLLSCETCFVIESLKKVPDGDFSITTWSPQQNGDFDYRWDFG